jgi:hypothetical protein
MEEGVKQSDFSRGRLKEGGREKGGGQQERPDPPGIRPERDNGAGRLG